MFGLGTLINTIAVIAGATVGMKLKKGLNAKIEGTLMSACGIATMFIGAAGTLAKMLTFDGTQFSTTGSMLLIFSLVVGGFIGEWIDIEEKMDRLGIRLKKLFHADKDNLFVDGFVTASLVICVGAMAIVGAIQDGISGNYETLAIKAILDFVIIIVYAASFGIGVMCSAIPIFVYQGTITLIAHFIGDFIPDVMMANLTFIGSALIFCVGINITFGKKIRVGNLLPALLLPIVAYFLPF